jgi:hypothetical protein
MRHALWVCLLSIVVFLVVVASEDVLLGVRWGGVLSLAEVCRFLPEFCQVVIDVPLRSFLGLRPAGAGAVMLVRQRWAVGDLEDWWTRVCGFVPSSIFSGFGS